MNERSGALATLGVIAVVVLLIVIGAINSGNDRLDSSPIGTKGLNLWLKEGGVQVATAHRRQRIKEEDVLLRVFPLYDVDLASDSDAVLTRQERNENPTQRDVERDRLLEKLNAVETFVLLPKWRGGVLELNLMAEQLRISENDANRVLRQIGFEGLRVYHPSAKTLQTDDVYLYAPQLFEPATVVGDCKPAVTLPQGVLVAKCQRENGRSTHVVADPDAFNNHGLRLHENAAFARDHIASILRGRDGIVYFDTTDRMLLAQDWEDTEEVPRRTSDDLARFLTYPFNVLFLSIGLLFIIAFWRGMIRFGPPAVAETEEIAATKVAAIDAKADLLRLVGQDAALAQEFVQQKMADLSQAALGIRLERPALMKRLTTLAPDQTPPLLDALGKLESAPPSTPTEQVLALAETFETAYRRLLDELGQISRDR